MKLFLVPAVLFLSAVSYSAHAAGTLLSCHFGNQITWSSVELSATGKVETQEFDVSISYMPRVESQTLTAAQLKQIKKWVNQAFSASVQTSEILASDGSRSGTLTLMKNGQTRTVHGIERNPTNLSQATEYRSQSAAVRELVDFCNSFMKIPLPIADEGADAVTALSPTEFRKVVSIVNRAIQIRFAGEAGEFWGHELTACVEGESCDYEVATLVHAPRFEGGNTQLQECRTTIKKQRRGWKAISTDCAPIAD